MAHTLEINGYDEEINSKNGGIMLELSSFLWFLVHFDNRLNHGTWDFIYIYRESYLKSAEVKAHTISGDTTHMPNLAKQNATFIMNSIHNWLPCFHLLFSPNSRCFRVSLNQIRKINENHGNMLKIIFYIYIYINYNNLRLILCLCLRPSNKMHFYPFCYKTLTKRRTNNFHMLKYSNISALIHDHLIRSKNIFHYFSNQ